MLGRVWCVCGSEGAGGGGLIPLYCMTAGASVYRAGPLYLGGGVDEGLGIADFL